MGFRETLTQGEQRASLTERLNPKERELIERKVRKAEEEIASSREYGIKKHFELDIRRVEDITDETEKEFKELNNKLKIISKALEGIKNPKEAVKLKSPVLLAIKCLDKILTVSTTIILSTARPQNIQTPNNISDMGLTLRSRLNQISECLGRIEGYDGNLNARLEFNKELKGFLEMKLTDSSADFEGILMRYLKGIMQWLNDGKRIEMKHCEELVARLVAELVH